MSANPLYSIVSRQWLMMSVGLLPTIITFDGWHRFTVTFGLVSFRRGRGFDDSYTAQSFNFSLLRAACVFINCPNPVVMASV